MANISSAQIDLIRGWFAQIEQLATERKTLTGVAISDTRTLDEIRRLAKKSQEYMKQNIT